MEKNDIRRLVKERKRGYSDAQLEEMSRIIIGRIRNLPQYRKADIVFAYMDLPGEVKMRDFICGCWEDGKTVAVPKIVMSEIANSTPGYKDSTSGKGTEDCRINTISREMRFFRIRSFEDLQEGTMHIMEPDPQKCDCLDVAENTLIIMPGVAFDINRHRIGYGGGFYDRYLAKHPDHPTVAAAYSFQVFDQIPAEAQDIRPQVLVTEEDVIGSF